MKVTTFRELMNGHAAAEVRCLYSRRLVRKLTATATEVAIDPTEGNPIVRVPLDTPITHEPWVMDRGNMLFATGAVLNPDVLPDGMEDVLKICGEDDRVTYPDGTTASVNPG